VKKINLKIVSIFILCLTGIILGYLFIELQRTEKKLAESFLQKSISSAESNMNSFFEPVRSELLAIREQAELGIFDTVTPEKLNQYFGPIIRHYSQISSMGFANTAGFELDVVPNESFIDNRSVWVDKWGWTEKWERWQTKPDQKRSIRIKTWEETLHQDPRQRTWFVGVMNTPKGEINWSPSYTYNTTFEKGMTATVRWPDAKSGIDNILALDLTLRDITKFTQNQQVSKRGKVFVLTKKGRYIGLPRDIDLKDEKSIRKAMDQLVDSVGVQSVKDAHKYWLSAKKTLNSFEYETVGESWWCKMKPFQLSKDQSYTIGVIVPHDDILVEVKKTKRVMLGGFTFILVLTAFTLYANSQSRDAYHLLSIKNEEINRQKMLIQRKSEEINDSITYAKRIQRAILPREQEINKKFARSFILFKPKDIVAGDFYWLDEKNGWTLFAVADCTGHGIPGAMVSVICKNALNRSVRLFEDPDPGLILNETRKMIVQEFETSPEVVKDGMDIALCVMKDNQLRYAGANNPLWIIRKGSSTIESFKANKQPVGIYDHAIDFETRTTQLNEGDTLYLFSDGFRDQFGGKKGKKFMSSNFRKLLLSVQHETMERQKELLDEAFENWKGDLPNVDDVCVMGVRI